MRGQVAASHGVRGQVRVRPRTDFPERLLAQKMWRLRLADGRLVEHRVEQATPHRHGLLAKLDGIDSREAADALRGAEVVVAPDELPPLPEGQYYWHQLIGLEVVTVDGESIGPVTDILTTGSNDVYVTSRALIPAIKEVIEDVDPAAGRIVIRPMPGLLS